MSLTRYDQISISTSIRKYSRIAIPFDLIMHIFTFFLGAGADKILIISSKLLKALAFFFIPHMGDTNLTKLIGQVNLFINMSGMKELYCRISFTEIMNLIEFWYVIFQ